MNQALGKRFYELDTAQDTDQKCWERYSAAATRTDRMVEHMEPAGSSIQAVLDKLRPDAFFFKPRLQFRCSTLSLIR